MASTSLPPFPMNSPPGSFLWVDWYRKLQNFIEGVATISWVTLDKSGSNLTDIVTRDHNVLQNIQGGTDTERYHLTLAQRDSVTALPSTFVTTFTQLTDTPASYAGAANYKVRVNAGATGLEFVPEAVYNLPAGVVLNLQKVGTNLTFNESNGDGTTTPRTIPL